MSQLIDIFLEPTKVWLQQKERPTFLLPALLLVLAVAIPVVMFYLQVDNDWLIEYQMQAGGEDIGKADIAKAQEMMPGKTLMTILAAVGTVMFLCTVFLITGGYYALAAKVAGRDVGFLHGLSLTTWGSMPLVIGSAIALFGVIGMSPQTTYESLQLLNIDPLFVQLEPGDRWAMLAKSFSLLNLWVWFLAALGWKTWTRSGWGQALFVVMLPSVVIYGAMALFALR